MSAPIATRAQWDAWTKLHSVPEGDLLLRPRAALATAMRLTDDSARRYLSLLRKAGLLRRVGMYGVAIVEPAPGSAAAEELADYLAWIDQLDIPASRLEIVDNLGPIRIKNAKIGDNLGDMYTRGSRSNWRRS
jgi:hypothetical protein